MPLKHFGVTFADGLGGGDGGRVDTAESYRFIEQGQCKETTVWLQ